MLYFCSITIVSKSFEGKTDKTEKYYETPYKIEDIPPDQIDVGAKSKLHCPDFLYF